MKYSLLLLSIIAFGLSSFFRKLSVDRIHPYQLQIVAGLVYAIEIPLWCWLISNNDNIPRYNKTGVLFGVLCIITHVVAAVLFGLLLKKFNSTGALSVLVSINPIITSLLSFIFLNEEFTIKKIIATCVTLLGVSLFVL